MYELIPDLIPASEHGEINHVDDDVEPSLRLQLSSTLCADVSDEVEDPYEFTEPPTPRHAREDKVVDEVTTKVVDLKRKDKMPELLKPAKKCKQQEVKEDIKSEIFTKCLGNYCLKISVLREAFQVREIEPKYVDAIVKSMREYADEAYQPPCVHLVNVRKEEFKEKQANGYTYDILGGQHMVAACKILAKEDKRFATRQCIVYADLSLEAKMMVSSQHNRTGENRNSSSLKDKVQFARRWMEKLAGEKTEKEARQSCIQMLGMKPAEAEIVMGLASKEQALYDKIIKMLVEAENGRLKDQRLTASERRAGIVRVPCNRFRSATKLSDTSLSTLIDEVLENDRCLKSFAKEAEMVVKLSNVQRAFVSVTKCGSWEEAQEKYPEKTKRESLIQYVDYNFKRGIPENFSALMRNPKLVEETSTKKVFEENDVRAVLVNDDVKEMGQSVIDESFGEKKPIVLSILDPDETWKEADLKEFLVSYQNMLVARETQFSTLVIMGSMDWIEDQKPVIDECKLFFQTEKMYIVNSFIKCTKAITKCVDGAILCFMSDIEKAKGDLKGHVSQYTLDAIVVTENEPREKVEGEVLLSSQKPIELMKNVIEKFSKPGDLIYCPCSGTGTSAVAALKLGRNSFSVEKDVDIFNCSINRIGKAITRS